MQPLRTFIAPAQSHLNRVIGKDGAVIVVSLTEAYTSTFKEVNRGKKLEHAGTSGLNCQRKIREIHDGNFEGPCTFAAAEAAVTARKFFSNCIPHA